MHLAWIIAGVLVALATTGVVVIVRTGWIQSRTMEKCVGLSVVLHLAFAMVATFLGGWLPASWGTLDEGRMTMVVMLADELPEDDTVVDSVAPPAEEALVEPLDQQASPEETASDSPPPLAPLVAPDSPSPPADVVPLLEVADAEPQDDLTNAQEAAPSAAADTTSVAANVPAVYADRTGPRRVAAALARGGSQETEQAVQAALAWLARNQSSDGLWNASRHGAGAGSQTGGQHPPQMGAKSDHGVTGLALLAFLGAGNTHRDGPHAEAVARGIAALVAAQRSDGSLAGGAEFFASLYCHGMATIAVAECLAMSGDESLRPVVERAIRYTIAMQHPHTGGWRYAAGDRGDTSQLGWQVMALYSARNARVAGLERFEAQALSFLTSVGSGASGGLASYRPGERPSFAMTSEALFCRLLHGLPPDHPASQEALALLARSAPGATPYDIYSWYYATLASFHAGGSQWDIWNARLQTVLLPLQHRSGGPLDGSWEPDRMWGRHGGRVYATAMAALTLEVYYRLQPLHTSTPRVASAPR